MFPVQLPIVGPDEFSRCDERIQQGDPGEGSDPIWRVDSSVKRSVERALWNDEVLRAIEYYEIDVHVKNGIVHLSGHIANTASRNRIENAIRYVPGILGIRNHLVLDDKLTQEVAGSLGALEHDYACKFFTRSSHGIVTLAGIVSNEQVKLLAEMCAARNPNVRAVINHVRVAGTGPESSQDEQPFLQPVLGETIYFADGASGIVKQVVVNPNNRRVIAMTVLVRFSDQRQELGSLHRHEARIPERLLVVSMDVVRYLTQASGFLTIDSNENEQYMDFDPASFVTPSLDWTPPYPYCPADVLFPVEKWAVKYQILVQHPQSPWTGVVKEKLLREELPANDNLGGRRRIAQ